MSKLFIVIVFTSSPFTCSSACCNLVLSTHSFTEIHLVKVINNSCQIQWAFLSPYLVLVSTALDLDLPPLCDAHAPRLPWLYSPGLLPTLPVPSQSLPQGCSLSLCCPTFLEFFPTSSSLLTPHTFPWVISCQISTSSIQISFLIFRFTNLSIGHIHFDIPQVAKLKMSRVEFVIDPEICCVLGPSEWHYRSLSYLSWAAGYNPSLSLFPYPAPLLPFSQLQNPLEFVSCPGFSISTSLVQASFLSFLACCSHLRLPLSFLHQHLVHTFSQSNL